MKAIVTITAAILFTLTGQFEAWSEPNDQTKRPETVSIDAEVITITADGMRVQCKKTAGSSNKEPQGLIYLTGYPDFKKLTEEKSSDMGDPEPGSQIKCKAVENGTYTFKAWGGEIVHLRAYKYSSR